MNANSLSPTFGVTFQRERSKRSILTLRSAASSIIASNTPSPVMDIRLGLASRASARSVRYRLNLHRQNDRCRSRCARPIWRQGGLGSRRLAAFGPVASVPSRSPGLRGRHSHASRHRRGSRLFERRYAGPCEVEVVDAKIQARSGGPSSRIEIETCPPFSLSRAFTPCAYTQPPKLRHHRRNAPTPVVLKSGFYACCVYASRLSRRFTPSA